MGGSGSGRSEDTAKLDRGLRLSIKRLLQDGVLSQKRGWRAGGWQWNFSYGGSVSVGYEVYTRDRSYMWMRLHYTHTPYYSGEPENMDYKIQIVTTRPHYGGERFWFVCPLTHERAAVLYSPSGSKWFASRHAFRRLKYRSQSRSAYDRAYNKIKKLESKLVDGGDLFFKPKGMHQKTYKKIWEQLDHAEEAYDDLWYSRMAGLFTRLMGDDALKTT